MVCPPPGYASLHPGLLTTSRRRRSTAVAAGMFSLTIRWVDGESLGHLYALTCYEADSIIA
ncbi:MAG: hypothetical protein K2I52_06380 [Muribaculaceae bacterium]|nr:hypothetical protein [Muribaculaceae bacterium]